MLTLYILGFLVGFIWLWSCGVGLKGSVLYGSIWFVGVFILIGIAALSLLDPDPIGEDYD